MMDRAPRIAIVSDALVQRGGAERVVEAMARAFPEAPIYALLYSPETGPKSLAGRVISSPLGRIPGATQRHRMLLPLYPAAIESFDLSNFDLILSSHHTVAKGILNSADSVHVCYCHTPMRALWERSHEELATLPPAMRPFAAAMFGRLRMWGCGDGAARRCVHREQPEHAAPHPQALRARRVGRLSADRHRALQARRRARRRLLSRRIAARAVQARRYRGRRRAHRRPPLDRGRRRTGGRPTSPRAVRKCSVTSAMRN